jgi:hypothetical protein
LQGTATPALGSTSLDEGLACRTVRRCLPGPRGPRGRASRRNIVWPALRRRRSNGGGGDDDRWAIPASNRSAMEHFVPKESHIVPRLNGSLWQEKQFYGGRPWRFASSHEDRISPFREWLIRLPPSNHASATATPPVPGPQHKKHTTARITGQLQRVSWPRTSCVQQLSWPVEC